jgi:hypothetical protein
VNAHLLSLCCAAALLLLLLLLVAVFHRLASPTKQPQLLLL